MFLIYKEISTGSKNSILSLIIWLKNFEIPNFYLIIYLLITFKILYIALFIKITCITMK